MRFFPEKLKANLAKKAVVKKKAKGPKKQAANLTRPCASPVPGARYITLSIGQRI